MSSHLTPLEVLQLVSASAPPLNIFYQPEGAGQMPVFNEEKWNSVDPDISDAKTLQSG